MLLALFAVLSSKHTKSNPILHFRTVFRPWKMTQSRKQPVFDTKRKIYFKARFKYILPLFRSLHLLERVPEKVQRQGWNLESRLNRSWQVEAIYVITCVPEYTKNSFKVEPDKPCFVYLKSWVTMFVGKHTEISVCFEKGTLRQCFF